ncbi:MAG: hypothetical protein MHPSP_001528 [Paramarteilia canceri]
MVENTELLKNFENSKSEFESFFVEKKLKKDNDLVMELYGLFKQATVGDVNISKPGFYKPSERAKYDLWEKNKGISKEDAMQKYIDTFESLKKKYS